MALNDELGHREEVSVAIVQDQVYCHAWNGIDMYITVCDLSLHINNQLWLIDYPNYNFFIHNVVVAVVEDQVKLS